MSLGMPLSTVTSLLQERACSITYNVLLKMLQVPHSSQVELSSCIIRPFCGTVNTG